MNLREHISEISRGIEENRFVNEASVSQGIVLRLLGALGWPTYDTQVVWPEYTIEGMRVDYALCHPKGKPLIFVEVKRVGQTNNAEKQLFEYSFHLGIPMAVLTDGIEWHFFLPGERGQYQERRVYKLDILERDADEIVERLNRYLAYEAVCRKEAIQAAREDYRNVSKHRELVKTLPDAWKKLVEEPDELLVELMADKVESLCGYKPDTTMVIEFLAKEVKRTDRKSIPQKNSVIHDDEKSIAPPDEKEYSSIFPCVDRTSLPAGLADVLEISLEVLINGKDYNDAVRDLCERRQLKSIHTIYDKCTRHIGLNTEEFRELLRNRAELSRHLKRRFPGSTQQIDNCFGEIV